MKIPDSFQFDAVIGAPLPDLPFRNARSMRVFELGDDKKYDKKQ
jgi:hypothetical protein